MSEREPRQFEDLPDEILSPEEENDGLVDNEEPVDVDGALASLLDEVIPSAHAEEMPKKKDISVEDFHEKYDWAEYEFLPEGISFKEYIFANAVAAWRAEQRLMSRGAVIAPLELMLAIVEKESAGSVVVNSPLDVSVTQREEGWYARGDKFSLAAGAAQMIPSTARGYGLRVMYTRDEVTVLGQKPQPKVGHGKMITGEGRDMILGSRGWSDGQYLYPIIDERTSVYHQMRGMVRMLSRLYERAQLSYSDPMDQMKEVASRYNSGRSKDKDIGNATDRQRDAYVEKVERLIGKYERDIPDYGLDPSNLSVPVAVEYEDADVKPLSIGDIVTSKDMKISLFRFLDENGGLRLDIPLSTIGGKVKIPRSKVSRARKRFGSSAWNAASIRGNVLTALPINDSESIMARRKSRDFSRSREDEIDLWNREGMWDLTLQDVIDLGIRPSELLRLNPELNIASILEYRLPHGYQAIIPNGAQNQFGELITRANAGLSEGLVDASERGRVVRVAKDFFTLFVSSNIVKTGTAIGNPFKSILVELARVGMVNSHIGSMYTKLSELKPGDKQWVDVLKDSQSLAPVFLDAGLNYLEGRLENVSEVSYEDYVASIAILELSQSKYVDGNILVRHAETFLFASTLVDRAAEVTEGIKSRKQEAVETWNSSWITSAVTLSEASNPAVQAIENLGEEQWRGPRQHAQIYREKLLEQEGFTEARGRVYAYLSQWSQWEGFEFDFDAATFGYKESSELSGVEIPLYKPTILMLPLKYTSEDVVVSYVAFDMAKWKTAEDYWQTGSVEEVSGGQNATEDQEISGGEGEFWVVGADGVGETTTLEMDKETDRDNLGFLIINEVWSFYLKAIMGATTSGGFKKERALNNGNTLEYVVETNVVALLDPNGAQIEMYNVDPFSLKIVGFYLDEETYEEKTRLYGIDQLKQKLGD